MLATGLKQLPSAVDTIPLRDVWELFEYWDQWPPEHVLLRGFVGYKLREKPEQPEMDPATAMGLAQFIGSPNAPSDKVKDLVEWTEKMKQKMGVNGGNA